VLSYCWLGVRKSIGPVTIERRGVGVVICLERGAGCLHMVAYGRTLSSLASFKYRLVQCRRFIFWCWNFERDLCRSTARPLATGSRDFLLFLHLPFVQTASWRGSGGWTPVLQLTTPPLMLMFLVPAYQGCPGKEAVKPGSSCCCTSCLCSWQDFDCRAVRLR